jgi:predicted kinase
MKPQTLVIITGHPASGKTTLSHRLADDLKLMCINKDEIKERLGETWAVNTREQSKVMGKATFEVMDYIVEEIIKAGNSLIVEANFPAKFYNEKFNKLKDKYKFRVVQIICWASADMLLERIKRRITSQERHGVHMDEEMIKTGEMQQLLGNGKIDLIAIEGKIIEVDTTDFSKINYSYIADALR